MKIKLIAVILIVALVTTSIGVVAARYGQGAGAHVRYVDADNDNDGVCDNRSIGGPGPICGGCGRYFVDADGDGVCDNIGINGRDDDGDGIPNGQDDDYVPLRDGSGKQRGKRYGCAIVGLR